MSAFPFYRQPNKMDCGPACLRMIAKYYGKHFSIERIRGNAGFGKDGVNLLGISDAAESMGFRTRGVQISFDQLMKEVKLPAIIHWEQKHFVVLLAKQRRFGFRDKLIGIADPASGIIHVSRKDFIEKWITSKDDTLTPLGTALLLEPSSAFYRQPDESENILDWRFILSYLRNSKWQVVQVFCALLISAMFQLIFPFLTKSLVDTGVNAENLQFISVVMIAQLFLVVSRNAVDFIRSRLLLSISSVLNLSLLSDFWIKVTKLPISHFSSFHAGDTMQRLNDNKQVQNFITGTGLSTFFSLFNFLIFSVVLLSFNSILFFVFLAATFIYYLWIRMFLSIRRKMNYDSFYLSSKENNATLQLVQGMQEIKLHNAEQSKRWEWENIQAAIFKLSFKKLSYNQMQQAGALLITQGKDIFISFLVARLVVEGKLTFGSMLAVQYILGQLSTPIEQFISFVQAGQDAKISLERLNEIHQIRDEEDPAKTYIRQLPVEKCICFSNLSFTYPGAGNEAVLKNISLKIDAGKTTAIVGVSGSGKTTLLKLLLKFYEQYEGSISIGDTDLNDISPRYWRSHCGAVLQDGYIFNDTIMSNICIGMEQPDPDRLVAACKTANIFSFIESLPNRFNTKLGAEGTSVSEGQKQRILIAREVYKDPSFMLFDEATNSLDANNEKVIVENLGHFFAGKTVIVVAHRLSTVKNADKIVVLHEGKIVEEGTHEELRQLNGHYFSLVKNQLELGN